MNYNKYQIYQNILSKYVLKSVSNYECILPSYWRSYDTLNSIWKHLVKRRYQCAKFIDFVVQILHLFYCLSIPKWLGKYWTSMVDWMNLRYVLPCKIRIKLLVSIFIAFVCKIIDYSIVPRNHKENIFLCAKLQKMS